MLYILQTRCNVAKPILWPSTKASLTSRIPRDDRKMTNIFILTEAYRKLSPHCQFLIAWVTIPSYLLDNHTACITK